MTDEDRQRLDRIEAAIIELMRRARFGSNEAGHVLAKLRGVAFTPPDRGDGG